MDVKSIHIESSDFPNRRFNEKIQHIRTRASGTNDRDDVIFKFWSQISDLGPRSERVANLERWLGLAALNDTECQRIGIVQLNRRARDNGDVALDFIKELSQVIPIERAKMRLKVSFANEE